MQIEIVLVSASLAGTVIVGVGLIKTWRRNGADQRDRDLKLAAERAVRDTRLEGKVDQVKADVKTNIDRTTEVKAKVEAMANHCAGKVAEFGQKHTETERRLGDLEGKAR